MYFFSSVLFIKIRVHERTAILVYICIERSESGAKSTPRILGGMPISGRLFLLMKKFANKRIIYILLLQALLLAKYQAEPIKGL